jgi:cobalt-zinc-cadmium efflux system membrane fusion protein
MGGFVKSTKLLQGMKVKKGEILAVMEHQDYIQLQQDYLETKSKLEYAGTEYERQEELAREDINTKKALQLARTQYQTLKATLAGLEAKLGLINLSAASLADGNIHRTINLYAPIGGYVTEVNVNLGQYVNATDVMFKIVNIEHLHAELQVYERDIHNIKIGQKVSFQLANESKMRMASVYLIGKEISAERTVRIHCHLDEEDESLLPGMYVKATIETALHDADVLPAEAVVGFEGEFFVFTEGGKKGQFEIIKVTTGNSTGDYIEVLLPDEFDRSRPVVTHGAFELLGILKNQGDE